MALVIAISLLVGFGLGFMIGFCINPSDKSKFEKTEYKEFMNYKGHTFYVTNSSLNIMKKVFFDSDRLVIEGGIIDAVEHMDKDIKTKNWVIYFNKDDSTGKFNWSIAAK
jgi:hypothetical protein